MKKIYVVTMDRLNRALYRVTSELDRFGIWNQQLEAVEVYLTVFNPSGLVAYGWKYEGRAGSITIPAISLPRLAHGIWLAEYVSLADVLRHEYAHAVADLYPRLIRSRKFQKVFGGAYHGRRCSEYDSNAHVSSYAASLPCEDFAETFMCFVRHAGRLPGKYDTPRLRRKWRFVDRICREIN